MLDWKQTFKTKQVLRIFGGLSARQLQYWDESGLVRPKIVETSASSGKIRYRSYSMENVVLCGLYYGLNSRGMSIQKIRSFNVEKWVMRAIYKLKYGQHGRFKGSCLSRPVRTRDIINQIRNRIEKKAA